MHWNKDISTTTKEALGVFWGSHVVLVNNLSANAIYQRSVPCIAKFPRLWSEGSLYRSMLSVSERLYVLITFVYIMCKYALGVWDLPVAASCRNAKHNLRFPNMGGGKVNILPTSNSKYFRYSLKIYKQPHFFTGSLAQITNIFRIIVIFLELIRRTKLFVIWHQWSVDIDEQENVSLIYSLKIDKSWLEGT